MAHISENLQYIIEEALVPMSTFKQIEVDSRQGLSQDLETGCLKLAVVKFLGVQIF